MTAMPLLARVPVLPAPTGPGTKARPISIGIIGLGAIAPYFLDAVNRNDRVRLAAVCDLDAAKLTPWSAGPTRTYDDHRALLAASGVDAVIITLPNHLHAPVARAALDAGIHVCCEKPLTIDPADARDLTATAERNGRVLFTAFHRRYNRHVARLAAEVAAAGSPPVAVHAAYDENIAEHTGGDTWYLDLDRCGGGCVIDNGPNALDAVRRVVGPLTLVDAVIGDVRAGVEHRAVLFLRTNRGVPVTVSLDWARPTGERKTVTVELADGRTLHADMLAGYDAFKSSLAHEYDGIVDDFLAAITAPGPDRDGLRGLNAPAGHEGHDGAAIVDLVADAYRTARSREDRLGMRSKHPVVGSLVKLLYHHRDDRGMTLSPHMSRGVRAGDVHELVTTTDRLERPGDHVDRVGFLGFAGFNSAGIIERGDVVRTGERVIGTVAGFDECHAPNHLNILIATDAVAGAGDLDLDLDSEVTFAEAGS